MVLLKEEDSMTTWPTWRRGRSRPCQNISLYEPEQSLSLSQNEGEQCWGVT